MRLPFRLERAWLGPVLQQDPVLARSFPRLLGPGHGTPGAVTGGPPDPVIVDRLSEREREVLECASGMLSTTEIADELYLSVNTVKSHLRSIFRKLGATRRGEAVRRARQLQLL
ncbi:MAG: helix-turn-helix transcriptional regulator [Actinobacteria bacterium]|nr:helix-turn-helix transcriptional regulator [Actinomycetota bacterium]